MNPQTVLSAHRPTDDDLVSAWPADERHAVWLAVREQLTGSTSAAVRRPAHRPTRRWVLAATAAALAAAVSIGPSLLSPDGAASAQAALQLVSSAQRTSAQVIPEGKFLHMVVTDRQASADSTQPSTRSTQESWTAADGRIWRKDVRDGVTDYEALPAWPSAAALDFSPRGTAALPSDPDALLRLLDAKVQGSASHHEAIFVAIGDMVRMGYVPPALRAAAIKVAASLPEVTAARADGRTTLSFADDSIRRGVVQSLIFDSSSAALIGERTVAASGFHYESMTTVSAIVDAVPADVLRRATAQAHTQAKAKA